MHVTTADLPTRAVDLPNVFNLRDLGGYSSADGRTVVWRTLFRADGLQRVAREDVARLRELGLRTVIDLRRPDEVELGRLTVDGLNYHNHSLQPTMWLAADFDESLGSARYLTDRYLEMTSASGAEVAAVLRLIADSASAPLVFHCAAGKDRTGVVAALTLSLLGVPDADIAADYALSSESTKRWLEWARINRPELAAEVDTLPGPWTGAPPEAIRAFLLELRAEHGSIDDYARSVGITDAELTALRSHLLEERSVV